MHTVELIVNDGTEDSEPDYVNITVIPPVEAKMKFTPQTLNCNSSGNWVKAHFTFPEGFKLEDVDVNSPAVVELASSVEPTQIESEYINVFVNE